MVAGDSGNDHSLVRLLSDGTLDVSFGTAGRSVVAVSASNWDAATALVQQADGKLVTAELGLCGQQLEWRLRGDPLRGGRHARSELR